MEEKIKQLTEQFKAYVPNTQVAKQFAYWTAHHQISVNITGRRKTKRGDYRPPFGNKGHRISINSDLNPYAFTITFIHEIAHLYTWNQFKNSVAPHGAEWKHYFQQLMMPFLSHEIFPADIKVALEQYMINPNASSCRDEDLMDALLHYDKPLPKGWFLLKNLPEGSLFSTEDGRVFKKGEVIRKNYRCQEMGTGKSYRISPQLKVIEYSNGHKD